jgi:hypothetical protein
MSNESVSELIQEPVKRKRGRPRKILTPEQQAELEQKKSKQPKLSLIEKQEIKVRIQKLKEEDKKKRNKDHPQPTDNFYCTNRDLQNELIKWYESAEKTEDRVISENLGKMLMLIGNKLLNHSSFRNYSKELKEDMLSYFLFKIIKGLKNYNFKFNNPFAFITMAAWNSYLSVITKHYKQMNIKKSLMKKMISELETYSGISPNTSLNKYIKNYLGEEFLDD